MKFQPGDRVSFINEKQDGVVIRTASGGKVTVSIEDGFEIEVSERELVKTGATTTEKISIPESITENRDEITFDAGDATDDKTIALVSVPEALGAVLTGPVQFYLVNKSLYEILYTCYMSSGKKTLGKKAGHLLPGEHSQLLSANRTDLFGLGPFQLELLLYSGYEKPHLTHIRKDIPILLPDLTTTGKQGSGRTDFAKVSVILDENQPEEITIKDLVEKWKDPKPEAQKPGLSTGKRGHVYFINEKTVDLHIEELTDDFSGMSHSEMLSLQMERFHAEMNDAMKSHLKRIIFIHGKGKGVLKQNILEALRNYKGVKVREADPFKYGQGATEVLF